jgi:hypothetical protein
VAGLDLGPVAAVAEAQPPTAASSVVPASSSRIHRGEEELLQVELGAVDTAEEIGTSNLIATSIAPTVGGLDTLPRIAELVRMIRHSTSDASRPRQRRTDLCGLRRTTRTTSIHLLLHDLTIIR